MRFPEETKIHPRRGCLYERRGCLYEHFSTIHNETTVYRQTNLVDYDDDPAVVEITKMIFGWSGVNEPLLDIQTLQIKKGERVFIESPSGSGKSTLLSLLIADGNPLEDLTVLQDYRKNLKLIMQDGKILRNTLVPAGDPDYRPAISSVVTN